MNTPNNGWIKMSDRKPTAYDYPIWAHGDIWTHWWRNELEMHRCEPLWTSYTYWKTARADIPSPPKKEPTQRERDQEAMMAWALGNQTNIHLNLRDDAWHAALAYRDKQNREDFKTIQGSSLCFLGNGKPGEIEAFANLRRRAGMEETK